MAAASSKLVEEQTLERSLIGSGVALLKAFLSADEQLSLFQAVAELHTKLGPLHHGTIDTLLGKKHHQGLL